MLFYEKFKLVIQEIFNILYLESASALRKVLAPGMFIDWHRKSILKTITVTVDNDNGIFNGNCNFNSNGSLSTTFF